MTYSNVFHSRRARLGATAAVSGLGILLAAACTTEQITPTRLCTPNAYVYCRCSDRSEGTKQCAGSGQSFADCNCAMTGILNPGNGNASFQEVDSGAPQAIAIDAKCAGKLAVLAGSSESLDLYGAAYGGGGKWTAAISMGGASLRGTPRGALVGSTLVAVWPTRMDLVAWTKFESGQTTLSPPLDRPQYAGAPPAFVGGATRGTAFYKAIDTDDYVSDSYTAGTGFGADGMTIPVPAGVKRTGASAVALGAGYALAFGTGADLSTVTVQTSDGTTWATAKDVPNAKGYNGQTPSLAALSGAEDLMIAYQGPDLLLHSVTRTKATGAWNAPVLVDNGAQPNGVPSLLALAEGRAMLVWRGVGNSAFYSMYTPGSPGTWSNPSGVVGTSPALRTPPSVAAGHCASDATVTYVDNTDGNVWLTFYKDGAWSDPFQVPGMTNMTYAGTGEVP